MKIFRIQFGDHAIPIASHSSGSLLDIRPFAEDLNTFFIYSGGIERLNNWLEMNEDICPIVSEAQTFLSPLTEFGNLFQIDISNLQSEKAVKLQIEKVAKKKMTAVNQVFEVERPLKELNENYTAVLVLNANSPENKAAGIISYRYINNDEIEIGPFLLTLDELDKKESVDISKALDVVIDLVNRGFGLKTSDLIFTKIPFASVIAAQEQESEFISA